MKLFYINLDSRPDRRRKMEEQLDHLGLAAERVSAITPDALSPELKRWAEPGKRTRWISEEELSCLSSHRLVWSAVLSRGLDCALVLEDDVVISTALPEHIGALETAAQSLDVIKIETHLMSVLLGRGPSPACAPDLRRLYTYHPGSGGYVVSRSGAGKLLEYSGFDVPADDVIFDPRGPVFDKMRVRQLMPALCVSPEALGRSSDNPSDLGVSSSRRAAAMAGRRWQFSALRRRIASRVREEARQLIGRAKGARTIVVPFYSGYDEHRDIA
jgi:glycosyl transferase family 25